MEAGLIEQIGHGRATGYILKSKEPCPPLPHSNKNFKITETSFGMTHTGHVDTSLAGRETISSLQQ